MLTGGEWPADVYELLLIPRRTRTFDLESLLAISRCRFSSRCSGVNIGRGGLDVKDLEPLGGGVRLLMSEPCPTLDSS